MKHGSRSAPGLARRSLGVGVHASPLAEKAAADPRRTAPTRLPASTRHGCSRWRARDDVESRLVVRSRERWSVRPGPLARRSLPSLATPAWTLLVQGVDLHDERAHRLLARFRFVADARLDDVMVSYASDGGGVGPHVDSYDVFLLQIAGRRRWRVGRADAARLRDDVPLKMLADFAAARRLAARPRRHALPAAGLGPRRHGRRRLLDRLDRLSRTARRHARAPTCCSVSVMLQRATKTRRRASGAAIATRGKRRAIGRRVFRQVCSASPLTPSGASPTTVRRVPGRSANRSANRSPAPGSSVREQAAGAARGSRSRPQDPHAL